jgi:integrase
MVPLDEQTVVVIDRIVARRTPGRPLPHPRSRHPTDFLLVHQGRRVSQQALRDELARACTVAGLDKVTPHALRHTFATALVMQAPWLALTGFFSLAIMLSLLVFIGEAVRDAFDPRKSVL